MVKGTKSFFGIDVSKEWFDLSVIVQKQQQRSQVQTQRFNNTDQGLKQLLKWLKAHSIPLDANSLVVMENTGVYHRLLWKLFSERNVPLHIGNAAHIKLSLGIIRGKNDMKDSQRLCDYCTKYADELKTTPLPDPDLHKLKDLHTARSRLLKQINSIKVFLKELKSSNPKGVQKLMEQSHKAAITGLNKSLKQIEEQVDLIIQQNQVIARNYKLLVSVPGIGRVTAIYLICCTNNFTIKINGKQLASYAGVVPFEYSSGKSVRGRNKVSKMANKELKKLLHLNALSAIKYYPEFRDYYLSKKSEGKHALSILNAIKNKILLRAASVINNERTYINNYQKIEKENLVSP